MAISTSYYGTVSDANNYFANRLFADAWTNANASDYPKALLRATQIIDALNYKGFKATVWTLFMNTPGFQQAGNVFWFGDNYTWGYYWPQPSGPTQASILAAEAAQPNEFPRGTDTVAPDAIVRACYEIAFSLLDGKDPELELENLAISSQGYSSVRTTYNRNQVPPEHLINGVPSAEAWRLLRPFLRDGDYIKLSRKS